MLFPEPLRVINIYGVGCTKRRNPNWHARLSEDGLSQYDQSQLVVLGISKFRSATKKPINHT